MFVFFSSRALLDCLTPTLLSVYHTICIPAFFFDPGQRWDDLSDNSEETSGFSYMQTHVPDVSPMMILSGEIHSS